MKQNDRWKILWLFVAVPVLNWLGSLVAGVLHLPFFFDSLGTVLGVIFGGFWVGAIGGAAYNVISALASGAPGASIWAIASVFIALTVWLMLRNKRLDLKKYPTVFASGLVLALLNSILTTAISFLFFKGVETTPATMAFQNFLFPFVPNTLLNLFSVHFIFEIFDKSLILLAAFGIYKLVSRKKALKWKELALPGAVLILVLVFSAWMNARENLTYAKAGEDILIKNQTQQAVSMLEAVYEGYQDGMFTLDQAKTMGAGVLDGLRYGDDNQGYFWADTSDGTNVVHAFEKNLKGKNRMNAEMSGIYYMRGIIANGQKPDGGYTDYLYPKPGSTRPVAKRAYSLYFKPFDWIVGTGYYLEDLGNKAPTKSPADSNTAGQSADRAVQNTLDPDRIYIASGHPEWPPIMWQEGNKIVGVGPQLVQKIAGDLGFKVESKYAGSWDEVQKKAEGGQVDMLAAAYKTAERETYMDYSDAYTTDPIALFVKKGKKFNYTQWADLIGKKGAATVGDSYGQQFDDYMKVNLKIERVASVDDALKYLENGQADYFIYSLYSGEKVLRDKKMDDRFEIIPQYVTEENFYLTVSKKSPLSKFLPQINQLIERYKGDGTIEKLIESEKAAIPGA